MVMVTSGGKHDMIAISAFIESAPGSKRQCIALWQTLIISAQQIPLAKQGAKQDNIVYTHCS